MQRACWLECVFIRSKSANSRLVKEATDVFSLQISTTSANERLMYRWRNMWNAAHFKYINFYKYCKDCCSDSSNNLWMSVTHPVIISLLCMWLQVNWLSSRYSNCLLILHCYASLYIPNLCTNQSISTKGKDKCVVVFNLFKKKCRLGHIILTGAVILDFAYSNTC